VRSLDPSRRSPATLSIVNRQRTRTIDQRFLRRIGAALLHNLLRFEQFDLSLSLLAAPEMARVNESFLGYAGSTDVIAFDYSDKAAQTPGGPRVFVSLPTGGTRGTRPALHGELLLSVDDAVLQARRFRTTWQLELVRYLIHGILHLLGYDDQTPGRRRQMKREEDRLLRELARRFDLRRLGRRSSTVPTESLTAPDATGLP
jgi:probable rRNA maturation factor